jgi:hypothetical protein
LKKIFVPTSGASDWEHLLAKPAHWKKGRSAMTLALSWEAAHPNFPPEVKRMLTHSGEPGLMNLEILSAVPEYKVPLPGGARDSQTDLMVVGSNEKGLAVIAVEGKVDESFGDPIQSKLATGSVGQNRRTEFLLAQLGLSGTVPPALPYQLFHRAVSALLVAREYHADTAVMLVHSFSREDARLDEFLAFADVVAGKAAPGRLLRARRGGLPALYIGWCRGNPSFLKREAHPKKTRA